MVQASFSLAKAISAYIRSTSSPTKKLSVSSTNLVYVRRVENFCSSRMYPSMERHSRES